MPDLTIRPATAADLPAITDIYNHFVSYCTSTLQDAPDTLAAREHWFAGRADKHAVTVAESEGVVLGFAALSAFDARQGFAGAVADTLFVAHTAQGRGVGSSLMKDLLARAKAAGHHTVISLIASNQTGMLRLREANGYVKVGTLTNAAIKFGQRLDIMIMQKTF